MLAMKFENSCCFINKDNGFLSFVIIISLNLLRSISIDKSNDLSLELNFALYNGFAFLKWSLFLVQCVFLLFY